MKLSFLLAIAVLAAQNDATTAEVVQLVQPFQESFSRSMDDVHWPVSEAGLEVRRSHIPGAGLGLFAKHDFVNGEFVATFDGKFVADTNTVADQTYIAEFDHRNGGIDARDAIASGGRYANHDRANANTVYKEDNNRLWLTATKAIKAGDEVLLDYGEDMDEVDAGDEEEEDVEATKMRK